MPNLFVPMIFAWLNFWRTCFSVSPSMYINPFMFPICPGVILSELSSSFRSNSLGVFDKQFRDCFRCVFSIVIRISLVPYTKPINIKKAEGHLPIRRTGSRSPTRTNRKHRSRICGRASILFSQCVLNFRLLFCTEISQTLFSSICKNTVGLRLHKDNKLLAKRVYEPFIFLPYYLKIQCL